MTGRYFGVLRLQGVIESEPGWGCMATFIRSGGKVIAYRTEGEAGAVAAKDRACLKVCVISDEVARRSGVVVVS